MTNSAPSSDLHRALDAAPVIDRDGLLGHTGGSAALAADIARMFVVRHTTISAPLHAALDRGDRAALAVAAHGARGAVTIVGAVRVALICAAVEAGAADLAACTPLLALLDTELARAAAELSRT